MILNLNLLNIIRVKTGNCDLIFIAKQKAIQIIGTYEWKLKQVRDGGRQIFFKS